MRPHHTTLSIRTPGRGLTEITPEVIRWLQSTGACATTPATASSSSSGLLTLFIRHTSASLLIQENADPDVQTDLEAYFARLVRDGDPLFTHRSEGPDDMPAHIRAALTQTHLSIPVIDGRLALGTWQGIYVWEHRRRGQVREVVVQWMGA